MSNVTGVGECEKLFDAREYVLAPRNTFDLNETSARFSLGALNNVPGKGVAGITLAGKVATSTYDGGATYFESGQF